MFPEKSNLQQENCNPSNKLEIWKWTLHHIKLWQKCSACDGREVYVSLAEKEHHPPWAAHVSCYSVSQQPFEPRLTPINLPSHVTHNVDRDE